MTQGNDPVLRVRTPRSQPDLFTILGIVLSLALVAGAIAMGNSNASFLDIP